MLGVHHVITMDLHHMQMVGFFGIPVDNIKTSPILIDSIKHVSPNCCSWLLLLLLFLVGNAVKLLEGLRLV